MPKKLTQEEFERKVREVHGDSIDITGFVYENNCSKGKVRCNKCGNEWIVMAYSLFNGHGCRKCFDKRNSIEKTKFSKDDVQGFLNENGCNVDIIGDFVNTKKKCLLKCRTCGHIFKKATGELYRRGGSACPKCNVLSMTTEELVCLLKEKYGNKYDYSKVVFEGKHKEIELICPKHGSFKKNVKYFLKTKNNNEICPQCIEESKDKIKIDFISRVKEIYKDIDYDLSEVEYNGSKHPVKIKCNIHNEVFYPLAKNVLKYHTKCSKCAMIIGTEKRHLSNEVVIERLKENFGDEYDLSNLPEYKSRNQEVTLICKTHGDFKTTFSRLFMGYGCSLCKSSKLEKYIANKLKENDIDFEQEKRFDWLGKQRLDFYLLKHNIAIECQGSQHYITSLYVKEGLDNPEENLNTMKTLDLRKKKLCSDNNIRLIYYLEKAYIKYLSEKDEYFTKFEDFLKLLTK